MGCFFSCFFSSPGEIVEYEQERERSTASPQEIVEYQHQQERSTASPEKIVEYEQERERSTSSPQEIVEDQQQQERSAASPQEIVEYEQERERSTASPHEIVEYQHQQERSIASPKLYDAFISHRGPDVKDTLAKQLYESLKARGCRAFLDREEIEGGDSITFAIRNGICSSLVQIAIFSKGYANSSWCLDELVLMLEQTDALFIPVFYDVEPWELRYIENENSQYAAAFSDYRTKGRNLDKLDKWKKALADAADKSGYELSQHQDNLCEKIVSRVLQEMEKRRPLPVAKYPVGLAELVEDFENSCSKTETDKVTMLGIFGLGGSGKTTLAKELLNRKRSGYSASCFLSDVRESHANRDLQSLQSQLLEDLFKEKQVFRNVDEGLRQLKHRLVRARDYHFLVVLDDIDHQDQLDALLPEGMLSSRSLVIITTRDQSVLRGADITITYRMKGMDKGHAKELFCSHAFRGRDPPISYEKLVERFVEFCGGLPLSLKVLGAHVYRRDKHYWELELEKVKKIQPEDIMKRLKISFDGLDREEKQIFIDIACCFNKMYEEDMKSKAISIWKASGWSAEHALQTLQDKSLLEVKEGDSYVFIMHDHLRDLGRQMADELGPPRLWRPDVLRSMEAKGFEKILAETKGRCFHEFVDSSLKTKITYFVSSSNDSAETQLLYLDIPNLDGNLENIPSWIPLRKLGCLAVMHIQDLWSTFQQQLQTDTQASFELRMLRIFHSRSSQRLPALIGLFSRLEELEIVRSLEETDITSFLQSLKQLSNLRSLKLSGEDFSGNLNLEASTSSRMNSLETIEFFHLDNISKLLISGEICPGLRSLTVKEMMSLNEMHLKQLKGLNILRVEMCHRLETISGLSSLTGLQSLEVCGCDKLETISGLSSLTGLQSLKVCYCEKLKTISELSSLTGLQVFEAQNCGGLKSLEASTSSRMNSLETIEFSNLANISKLVITGEICPRLRSLTVQYMWNLNEMHLKQLKGLNILRVEECDKLETLLGLSSLTGLQSLRMWGCPKLETISGLSSLTGLQSLTVSRCDKLETLPGLSSLTGLQSLAVSGCEKLETITGLSSLTGIQVLYTCNCEGLKSLPTLAHLPCLERITIVECHQLQSIEGFEELQGLKSLQIEVPYNGYALVRNCVHGLKRLPSEYSILIGNARNEALSRLNVKLFSDMIGAQSVAEIERGKYLWENPMEMEMKMRSSSRVITIYFLLITPGDIEETLYNSQFLAYRRDDVPTNSLRRAIVPMVAVLLIPHNTNASLTDILIEKGFVATVNEEEEGKALTLLQTIVDRLFGESMAANDVGTDESERESELGSES